MALIIVKSKKCVIAEELLALGIPPKGEEDFGWMDTCIRTEDIMEFYRKSDAKVVISFYDERPSLIIKEPFEELLKRISQSDYGSSYDDD